MQGAYAIYHIIENNLPRKCQAQHLPIQVLVVKIVANFSKQV